MFALHLGGVTATQADRPTPTLATQGIQESTAAAAQGSAEGSHSNSHPGCKAGVATGTEPVLNCTFDCSVDILLSN